MKQAIFNCLGRVTKFQMELLQSLARRWELRRLSKPANEAPTEAEPNVCVFCKGPVTKAWLYCGDTCCSEVCLHNHVNAVMQKLEKRQ